MAPSRRNISGRSPLVNQNRQITSFFSKTTSVSHCPSPSPAISKENPKLNPNPKPELRMSPRSSPSTRSPIQSKLKKHLLVIGQSPSTPAAKSYGEEVLERRIEVYRPWEKAWYKGVVKSFDKESGKHLVQYDDAEEESLDLGRRGLSGSMKRSKCSRGCGAGFLLLSKGWWLRMTTIWRMWRRRVIIIVMKIVGRKLKMWRRRLVMILKRKIWI